MPVKTISCLRPAFWLLFYVGLLPCAGTRCLDWLLGLLLLAAGVVLSLCQAGRSLWRY
jgi:hypothetical protein